MASMLSDEETTKMVEQFRKLVAEECGRHGGVLQSRQIEAVITVFATALISATELIGTVMARVDVVADKLNIEFTEEECDCLVCRASAGKSFTKEGNGGN